MTVDGTDRDAALPRPEPIFLTREIILDGTIHRMLSTSSPGMALLTDEERRASLQAVLADRPSGEPVWLFAYGSLIWNPTIDYAERRVAVIHGWHRAFCLSTSAGRGTPEAPGLMLGLDSGGDCAGVALRIDEAELHAELDVLWRREMIATGYVPRWVSLRGEDGAPFGHAIAFTINRDGCNYVGRISEDETVRRLATARGHLGSCADYLFRTRDGLRGVGLRDPFVEQLADRVWAAMQAAR